MGLGVQEGTSQTISPSRIHILEKRDRTSLKSLSDMKVMTVYQMVISAIKKDKAGGGGGERVRVGVRVSGKPR